MSCPRSPKLLAVIKTHSLSIPDDQVNELPSRSERVNLEHAQIMAAVKQGDGAVAESLMRQHIVNIGDNLVSYLEAQRARPF